ncbi:MAG TPA: DNA-binding protein [Nitrososphaerales archaeon]|nr:DNA-binding protein [Nitrososphaerales archaeon]
MEEDQELRMIERRKLAAMKRRISEATAAAAPKPEKSDREVLLSALYDRGDEVLETAYSFYPDATEKVVAELARLIRDGKFTGRVTGGELYALFRQVGLRFNLKTSIKVQENGRFVDLSEKLKSGGD